MTCFWCNIQGYHWEKFSTFKWKMNLQKTQMIFQSYNRICDWLMSSVTTTVYVWETFLSASLSEHGILFAILHWMCQLMIRFWQEVKLHWNEFLRHNLIFSGLCWLTSHLSLSQSGLFSVLLPVCTPCYPVNILRNWAILDNAPPPLLLLLCATA